MLRLEQKEIDATAHAEAKGFDEYTPLFLVSGKRYSERDRLSKTSVSRSATTVEIDTRFAEQMARLVAWVTLPRPQQPPPRAFIDVAPFAKQFAVPAMARLLAALSVQASMVVPVTRPDETLDHALIKAHQATHPVGIALSVDGTATSSAALIAGALTACGVTYETTDLLVDMGEVSQRAFSMQEVPLRGRVASLTALGKWRSVTLVGGAMIDPKKPGPLRVSRYEWLLWESLRNWAQHNAVQLVAYGDHCTVPPTFLLFARAPAPYLRYTASAWWWIRRIKAARTQRPAAYRQICIECRATPEYVSCGPGFSVGDARINAYATTGGKPGAAAKWVTTMIDHHLRFVGEQIAAIP